MATRWYATEMNRRLLGIDYGTKRVGVAVSDEEGRIAFPKTILPNDTYLLGSITELCSEEKVQGIVLGESRDYKNDPNPLLDGIMLFKERLARATKLPIYLEPEFMTSAQATHIQGKSANIDASAAALILQSFIDRRQHS